MKRTNKSYVEEVIKVDDYVTVIKEEAPVKKEDKPKRNTNKEINSIKEVLTDSEIYETKRCYGIIGHNEPRDGICKICGKQTSFKGRYLCYEHYKKYLSD